MHFWGFGDLFIFLRQPFAADKTDVKFETRYVKGVPLVNRRYKKGVIFMSKMLYKRFMKGLDLGAEPPGTKLC